VNIEEVIIIGAGPAGLATALQLKRYSLNPLVLEQKQVGGLLHNANLVENYPGFPGGIPGRDLVRLFEEQTQDYSIRITLTKVQQLDYLENLFRVSTADQEYQARIVVIATGTKPHRFSDFSIPTELRERVYYEVYPLLNLHDKQIAIVGAGDAAFDYALNLGKHNDILILNRGEKISCLPLLSERAQLVSRITYLQNMHITKLSSSSTGKLLLACSTPGGPDSLQVDILVGALGRDPQLDFISGQFADKAIQLQDSGELYYAGDVVNGLYRQTAIAVGNGILTAMQIYEKFKENAW
jgi:thioredoxin reductase (NADPH)